MIVTVPADAGVNVTWHWTDPGGGAGPEPRVHFGEENVPPGELADQETVPVGFTPTTLAVQVTAWPAGWLDGPQETVVVV